MDDSFINDGENGISDSGGENTNYENSSTSRSVRSSQRNNSRELKRKNDLNEIRRKREKSRTNTQENQPINLEDENNTINESASPKYRRLRKNTQQILDELPSQEFQSQKPVLQNSTKMEQTKITSWTNMEISPKSSSLLSHFNRENLENLPPNLQILPSKEFLIPVMTPTKASEKAHKIHVANNVKSFLQSYYEDHKINKWEYKQIAEAVTHTFIQELKSNGGLNQDLNLTPSRFDLSVIFFFF